MSLYDANFFKFVDFLLKLGPKRWFWDQINQFVQIASETIEELKIEIEEKTLHWRTRMNL